MGQVSSGPIACPPCLAVLSSFPRREMQLFVSKMYRLRPVNQDVAAMRPLLPVTESLFKQMLSLFSAGVREVKTLDSLEILVLSILLHSESTALDKVKLLLEIFDLNGDQQLSVEELSLLSQYVARAFTRLGHPLTRTEVFQSVTGITGEISDVSFPSERVARHVMSTPVMSAALMALPGRAGEGASPDRVRISDSGQGGAGGPVEVCPVHMVDPRTSRSCRLPSETEILVISRFIEVIKAKTAVLLDGRSRKVIWSEICRLVETCRSSLSEERKSDLALLTETLARPLSNLKTFITASRAEAIRVVTLRDLLRLVCPCASDAMIDGYLVFFIEAVARLNSPSELQLRPTPALHSKEVGMLSLTEAVKNGLIDAQVADQSVLDGRFKSKDVLLTKSVFLKHFVSAKFHTAAALQWDHALATTGPQGTLCSRNRVPATPVPAAPKGKVSVAVNRAIDEVTAQIPDLTSPEDYARVLLENLETITEQIFDKKKKTVATASAANAAAAAAAAAADATASESGAATIDLLARRTGDQHERSLQNLRELNKLQQELAKLAKEEAQVSAAKQTLLSRVEELSSSLSTASREVLDSATKLAAVSEAPLAARRSQAWLDRCSADGAGIVRELAEQFLGRFGDLAHAVLFIDERRRGQVTCSDLAQSCAILGLNESLVSDAFRFMDADRRGSLPVAMLFERLVAAAGRATTDVFDGRVPPPAIRKSQSRKSHHQGVRSSSANPASAPTPGYAQPRGERSRSVQAGHRTGGPEPQKTRPSTRLNFPKEATTADSCGEIFPGAMDSEIRISRDKLRFESARLRNLLTLLPSSEQSALRSFYSEFGTKVHRRREAEQWSEFEAVTTAVLTRKTPTARRKAGDDVMFLKSPLAEVLKMQKTLLNQEDSANLESGNFTKALTRRRDAASTTAQLQSIAGLGLQASGRDVQNSETSDDSEESAAGDPQETEEERHQRKKRTKLQKEKDEQIYRSRLFLQDTKTFNIDAPQ